MTVKIPPVSSECNIPQKCVTSTSCSTADREVRTDRFKTWQLSSFFQTACFIYKSLDAEKSIPAASVMAFVQICKKSDHSFRVFFYRLHCPHVCINHHVFKICPWSRREGEKEGAWAALGSSSNTGSCFVLMGSHQGCWKSTYSSAFPRLRPNRGPSAICSVPGVISFICTGPATEICRCAAASETLR